MKIRTFAILLVAFCILLAVVLFTSHRKKTTGERADMGAKLFTGLSAGDIAAITITGPEGAARLKQAPNGWIVENRFEYPADFTKIADLVQKLSDAKVGRSFPASPEIQARQALYPPEGPEPPADQKGTRIVLADKDAKILADLIIGKQRDGSPGADAYYVLRPSEGQVYLIDQNFRFLEKKPAGWLNKKPIDLNPKSIEKVVCLDPRKNTSIYTLKRPAQDTDPVFAGLPAGRMLAISKVDQVFEALTSFTVEDVADPAAVPKTTYYPQAARFEYHLFDGTIYHVYPGAALKDGSENHYFRVEVRYRPPDKADPAQKESQANLAEEAAKLNLKISPWTYVISKWVYDSFITDPKNFIEKKDKK